MPRNYVRLRIKERRRRALKQIDGPTLAGSIGDYAIAAGVSVATIHRWIKDKKIESILIGGRRIITAREFQRLRGE